MDREVRSSKAFSSSPDTKTDGPCPSASLVGFFKRTGSGRNLVVLGDLLENSISAFAGLFHIASLQRKSETLGGRVRLVNGEVTPPHAAVIPEVMIGVVVVDAERELGFAFHTFFDFWPGLVW